MEKLAERLNAAVDEAGEVTSCMVNLLLLRLYVAPPAWFFHCRADEMTRLCCENVRRD